MGGVCCWIGYVQWDTRMFDNLILSSAEGEQDGWT